MEAGPAVTRSPKAKEVRFLPGGLRPKPKRTRRLVVVQEEAGSRPVGRPVAPEVQTDGRRPPKPESAGSSPAGGSAWMVEWQGTRLISGRTPVRFRLRAPRASSRPERRLLDTQEVAGSTPASPTSRARSSAWESAGLADRRPRVRPPPSPPWALRPMGRHWLRTPGIAVRVREGPLRRTGPGGGAPPWYGGDAGFDSRVRLRAGVVQWQDPRLPTWRQGFESPHPLQLWRSSQGERHLPAKQIIGGSIPPCASAAPDPIGGEPGLYPGALRVRVPPGAPAVGPVA